MWVAIRRGVVPGLLLAGGIASVIYGAAFHSAVVMEEQEIEISIAPPPMPDFPPGGPPGFEPPPFGGLPPEATKVKEKVLVPAKDSEPRLIREVSIGGVTLLATGELMRTYTGVPPSLCPT